MMKTALTLNLRSPLFDRKQAQMLLSLRTRTVRGIKTDFKGMYQDILCPLECGATDTLPNILTCTSILNYFESNEISSRKVVFEDVFSQDIQKQKEVTELFIKLLDIREKIINNNPVMTTGPCIDLQRSSILSADIYALS